MRTVRIFKEGVGPSLPNEVQIGPRIRQGRSRHSRFGRGMVGMRRLVKLGSVRESAKPDLGSFQ